MCTAYLPTEHINGKKITFYSSKRFSNIFDLEKLF